MKTLGRLLLNAVSAAVCLLLVISMLAGVIRPSGHNLPGLLGLVYPFLVVAAVCCIVVGILLKNRWTWVPVVVLIMGIGHLSHYVAFKRPDRSAEGQHIRMVTYNVMGYMQNDREAILNYLRSAKADIICLQEAPGSIGFYLKDEFPELPYRFQPGSNKGPIITLSRWPILASGSVDFSEKSNGDAVYCDILVERDTVRVYSLHLKSYGLARGETAFIDTMHLAVRDSSQWVLLKELGVSLTDGMAKRSLQADDVRNHWKKCAWPVIVCGDFNDTPLSFTYQRVKGGLQDAFSSSGKILGGTYRIRGDYALRIDYFLCDRRFKVSDFKIPHLTCSDHYPVFCELVIPACSETPSRNR